MCWPIRAASAGTGAARFPAGLSEQDRYVTKGGSHLCAPSYCHQYRPAARQAHAAGHILAVGFAHDRQSPSL